MRRLLLASLALLVTVPAQAQESLDDLPSAQGPSSAPVPEDDAEGKGVAEANGYAMNRLSYAHVDPFGLAPTQDFPSVAELAEANVQLRVSLGDKRTFVYGDLSLVYQAGWLYYVDGGSGVRKEVSAHDVPSLRPFVVPSELYFSGSPKPWLNLLVGKKRVTWGSGFAFNPMDLVSPPKDPTDPAFQRTGNWMARVELPFEKFTITTLFAPQALLTQDGIPYALLRYPSYAADGVRDDASHYLAAARLYLLLADTDANLVYYFSNRYQDDFQNKSRLGLSLSRVFFSDSEIHFEGLLTAGSARRFPNHGCADATSTCDPAAAFSTAKLSSGTLYPRVVFGTRRQFAGDSFLSLEYYFQADGYTDSEFADAMAIYSRAGAQGLALVPSATQAGELPQRYAFEPLRRHYLMASYSRAHIFDDWSVASSLIAGLRDLSGLFSLSVGWSAREWLTLTLYGYAPIRGLGVGEARVGGQSISEYSLQPYDFRMLFEARAYY